MNKTPIKVILKTEPNGDPIFFLPTDPANPGMICYCSPSEGHGEACLAYYYECKPYADETLSKAPGLLSWYENYGGEFHPVKRVYRQSAHDRVIAYKRYTT